MKRLSVFVLAVFMVVVLSSVSLAAEVPCADAAARVRCIETISFLTPYCYSTSVTEAYTAWYPLDLYVSSLGVTDAALTFDFSPDGNVITVYGGYDATWTPPALPDTMSTILGTVTVSGTAVVAFNQIIIQ
ncbi:MAG: hypothetical protein C0402_01655 [Thermodesulfovibrio sp.]|nr:hypothetical protein [Thermodesulfovibrio sp.]